ncbi:Protein of unknown function [Pseudoxanthobacter soli DSM 19599]|uniref:DUF1656 domain-containing protein n=1 Tax=Pseudoxanthobacter soli DSM 19599 TaxID=1123029 RepID=A0A1M7ZAI9_9HYPH|nr:Protein of unknown function [Pseudoxanthobacter soli DSM 19599]
MPLAATSPPIAPSAALPVEVPPSVSWSWLEPGNFGNIDLFGFYLAPMMLWLVLALVPFGLARLVLKRTGFYRFVWHSTLFDTALYVLALGVTTLAGGVRWL